MDALLEYRLSQEEDKDIRRLIWILQIKQSSFKNSRTRRWFNIKRDKQIIILKDKGYDYGILCDKAETYKCMWEMFD